MQSEIIFKTHSLLTQPLLTHDSESGDSIFFHVYKSISLLEQGKYTEINLLFNSELNRNTGGQEIY